MINIEQLKLKQEDRKRDAFFPSDYGKPLFDLYNSFVGTPKTNPLEWYDTIRMGAGNGVEQQLLRVLKDSGIVKDDYDQNVHGKIEFGYKDITVRGRVDAITTDGYPIEIKSINNKNRWDIAAYKDGYPRENYVGQLAIYCHALGVSTGYMFVSSVDGLERFLFECTGGPFEFKCGNVVVDLRKEYDRWNDFYNKHVLTGVEPDPFEYTYKYPVETINWRKVSKEKISKARNNHAVIGDYQVQYSQWKDLWIQKQGVSAGYTPEELKKIRELTDGYSKW
jgi:hypothetical protein